MVVQLGGHMGQYRTEYELVKYTAEAAARSEYRQIVQSVEQGRWNALIFVTVAASFVAVQSGSLWVPVIGAGIYFFSMTWHTGKQLERAEKSLDTIRAWIDEVPDDHYDD